MQKINNGSAEGRQPQCTYEGDCSTYTTEDPHRLFDYNGWNLILQQPAADVLNNKFSYRVELKPRTVFIFTTNEHVKIKEKENMVMSNKSFLNVEDVAKFMDISVPMAYKIIRKLNDDLKKQGFITVAGKISRRYFEEKVYGVSA